MDGRQEDNILQEEHIAQDAQEVVKAHVVIKKGTGPKLKEAGHKLKEAELEELAESVNSVLLTAKAKIEEINKIVVNVAQKLSSDIDISEIQTVLTSKKVIQFFEVINVLSPYIDIEQEANEELYRNPETPVSVLLAAAARRAREDGKEIPVLWFETDEAQTLQDSEIAPNDELSEAIQTLQALKPLAHIMPNNSLMNEIVRKPAINAGPFDLVVSTEKGRRKEITNYTIINYDPGDSGITITDPKLSEYERQVSDAVISLWMEAKRQNMPPVFTVDMIYQSMPGGGERPQPAQRAAITRTIEKLRRLHIFMDATEEMRKRRKIGSNATFTMDAFYFQVDRAVYKARNSRQAVTAYKMESAPIMLTYSQMTGQLLTVQARYLDIRKVKTGLVSSEVIPATAGRQAMIGYMLRRIAIMRHDEEAARDAWRQYVKNRKKELDFTEKPPEAFRKQSRIILFDTIFTEAGTATESRTQTMENRNFCFDVLEYWQASGLIKGYSEQRNGKKITGFSVMV